MRNCRRRSRQGYSLIELLAALTIFGLGVLGSMELFAVCLQSTSASLGYTQAALLAQGRIEEIIAEENTATGTDSGDFGDDFPGHSWETHIENTHQDGLISVEVVVTWTERGRDKAYRLTTLVAERGLEIE